MRRPTERIQPPTSLSTPAVGCVRSGRPFGSPRKTRSHPATQRHPGPPTSLLSVWEHGIPSPGPTPLLPFPFPSDPIPTGEITPRAWDSASSLSLSLSSSRLVGGDGDGDLGGARPRSLHRRLLPPPPHRASPLHLRYAVPSPLPALLLLVPPNSSSPLPHTALSHSARVFSSRSPRAELPGAEEAAPRARGRRTR